MAGQRLQLEARTSTTWESEGRSHCKTLLRANAHGAQQRHSIGMKTRTIARSPGSQPRAQRARRQGEAGRRCGVGGRERRHDLSLKLSWLARSVCPGDGPVLPPPEIEPDTCRNACMLCRRMVRMQTYVAAASITRETPVWTDSDELEVAPGLCPECCHHRSPLLTNEAILIGRRTYHRTVPSKILGSSD